MEMLVACRTGPPDGPFKKPMALIRLLQKTKTGYATTKPAHAVGN